MILDVCCGSEKIYQGWQDRLENEFVTMDLRKGDYSYQRENDWFKHEIIVKPDVLADMRYLPFKDGCIQGIVCDPPHLKCGDNSYMNQYYGSWDQYDAIRTMRLANSEFARVLDKNGFLLLKTMLDRKNTYREMLTSFVFFLPIQILRPMGSKKDGKLIDGALWMIGCKVGSCIP